MSPHFIDSRIEYIDQFAVEANAADAAASNIQEEKTHYVFSKKNVIAWGNNEGDNLTIP